MVERLTVRLALLVAVVAAVTACSARTSATRTARFNEGGVTVWASWQPDGDALVVRLAPDEPGFHVYSLDLPAGGIDGLGVPTRVRPAGRLSAAGVPHADRAVQQLRYPALGVALPVYPSGAVEIAVAVHDRRSGEPIVVVSYAACSDARCNVPVRDAELHLH